ncbi:MAG: SDR family oxidoreductase [Propionibacteriaceae bacterium]|nr:SDR family oxidoreductase [Propionibacteriaceae bacterium]
MKVLILGASGMLGQAVVRTLSDAHEIWGLARSTSFVESFPEPLRSRLLGGIEITDNFVRQKVLDQINPDVIVNCIGIVKQMPKAHDAVASITVNSLLPHQLTSWCELHAKRLITISTDCVFDGRQGMHTEDDLPNAEDLYGQSKALGEVKDSTNAITLRTSIIGHELTKPSHSLLEWFLAQFGVVHGFGKAVFSGLPTNELGRVIRDYVIPNHSLHGLFQVAAEPIDKLALLMLFKEIYNTKAQIVPDNTLIVDRSLDGQRFQEATGYVAPPWSIMIEEMHDFAVRAGLWRQ